MIDDMIAERKAKTIEPSNRWRNWWRGPPFALFEDPHGRQRRAGADGVVFHPAIWPSKEIAEAVALESISKHVENGLDPAEYLGAYPDGERP